MSNFYLILVFLYLAGAIWSTDLTMMFPNDRVIITTTNFTSAPAGTGAGQGYMSLQFINYAIALFMLMIRYPTVYWYTSRPFSCLFSFQLFMLLLQSLIAFCGFSVIVKAQVNRDVLSEFTFCLGEGTTVVLFLIASLLTFMQNLAVFEYGYHHYVQNRKVFRHRLHPSFEKPAKKAQTCQGYIPHISAMSLMLVSVVFKAAIVYDGGMIYRWYNDRLLLWYIVLEVCYLFFWIILWFALTVKQEWDFKFKFPYWHEKTNVFTIQNNGFRESSDLNLVANEETPRHGFETFVDDASSNPTSSVTTADVIAPSAPIQEPDVCAIKIVGTDAKIKAAEDSSRTATIGSNRSKSPAPIKMPDVPPRNKDLSDHIRILGKNRSNTPMNNYLGSRGTTPINSLPGTPVNSAPTTPLNSRPMTPLKPLNLRPGTPGNSRPTTPKPKSRDHPLNRSDRKKCNRVTFEDCVARNGNYSDDTDEEPACDDEDMAPDSSNCSTSSQEGKPDPRPVGILKKPNRPQSPNPADIANALEGIKNAAKQLKPAHVGTEGALQPQIRSKLNRSNSRSSDISLCSDITSHKSAFRNSDNYSDGSLPRHFQSTTNPCSDYADYYSLQDFPIGGSSSNSRGNPNYASSGKGYDSRSRAPDVLARPRTPVEGMKPHVILPTRPSSAMGNYDANQLDSGVELSDSSTVTTPYSVNNPRGPVVFLNNKDYFTPSCPGSQRDSANCSMSSPESAGSDANNPNNRLCSQV
jgi:hypothetical protein